MAKVRRSGLSRVGQAISSLANRTNNYMQARNTAQYLQDTEDPFLATLMNQVDYNTGGLNKLGQDLLTNYYAGQRANAVQTGLMQRALLTQGRMASQNAADRAEEGRARKLSLRQNLLPKYKESKGKSVMKDGGILFNAGYDPNLFTPEQIDNITEYMDQTGRLPRINPLDADGNMFEQDEGFFGMFRNSPDQYGIDFE